MFIVYLIFAYTIVWQILGEVVELTFQSMNISNDHSIQVSQMILNSLSHVQTLIEHLISYLIHPSGWSRNTIVAEMSDGCCIYTFGTFNSLNNWKIICSLYTNVAVEQYGSSLLNVMRITLVELKIFFGLQIIHLFCFEWKSNEQLVAIDVA